MNFGCPFFWQEVENVDSTPTIQVEMIVLLFVCMYIMVNEETDWVIWKHGRRGHKDMNLPKQKVHVADNFTPLHFLEFNIWSMVYEIVEETKTKPCTWKKTTTTK
jgi:hypothetical protein